MALGRRCVTNFGGNVSFVPATIYRPRTDQDVLDCMRRHPGERMRCFGAGHSWSAILATEGVLFDLRGVRHIEIEPSGRRVRVGAGCTLRRLLKQLRRRNLTLPTLGAIQKQTVAGAVATGTHGSGCESLSHFVEEARIATFDPETGEPCLKTFDHGPELLAARCALGSLGIVVELVLKTVNRYRVEEHVVKTGRIDEVLDGGLKERPPWPLQQFGLLPWSWQYIAYRRRQTNERGSWLRARISRFTNFWMNDIALHVILKCLLAYAGRSRWLQLAGFTRFTGEASIRAFFRSVPRFIPTGRRIDESTAILTLHHDCFRHVEMELFVPESKLRGAIALIKEIAAVAAGENGEQPEVLDELSPGLRNEVWKLRGSYTLHYLLFFRRVLTEDTLVSMASAGEHGDAAWYAISLFTYRETDEAFSRFTGTMAMCLAKLYGARPHWGKYFPIPLELAAETYPRFEEFRGICRKYDRKQQFWY